jgi:hypothetical protein
MTKINNSASRLYKILFKSSNFDDRNKASEVWVDIFGIEEKSKTKKSIEVIDNLGLLHAQFELVKEQAEASGFSKELYKFAFDRIEHVLLAENLTQNWANFKVHLGADTLLAINWLSEVFPKDEFQVDSKVIQEINELLNTLKSKINSENIPDNLKRFIENQIYTIEQALSKQEIIGVRAFRDGLYKGYNQTNDNTDVVEEHSDSEHLKTLGSVWSKIKKVPGVVVSSDKFLNASSGVFNKTIKLIDYISNF